MTNDAFVLGLTFNMTTIILLIFFYTESSQAGKSLKLIDLNISHLDIENILITKYRVNQLALHTLVENFTIYFMNYIIIMIKYC